MSDAGGSIEKTSTTDSGAESSPPVEASGGAERAEPAGAAEPPGAAEVSAPSESTSASSGSEGASGTAAEGNPQDGTTDVSADSRAREDSVNTQADGKSQDRQAEPGRDHDAAGDLEPAAGADPPGEGRSGDALHTASDSDPAGTESVSDQWLGSDETTDDTGAEPETLKPAQEPDAPDRDQPMPEPIDPGSRDPERRDPHEAQQPSGAGGSDADGSPRDEPAPGAAQRAGLKDVPASHPETYAPSDAPPPNVDRPHAPPEGWIDAVNPGSDAPGRKNNCGECARAVQSTWEGEPAVAAAMRDPNSGGEYDSVMTDAVGAAPVQTSMGEIGQNLTDLGPGSSALVGVSWEGGDGHWFNAVNDGGTVKAVDGQSGRVEPWPPSHAGLGYDEGDTTSVEAVFFDSKGEVTGR